MISLCRKLRNSPLCAARHNPVYPPTSPGQSVWLPSSGPHKQSDRSPPIADADVGPSMGERPEPDRPEGGLVDGTAHNARLAALPLRSTSAARRSTGTRRVAVGLRTWPDPAHGRTVSSATPGA